MNHELNDYLHKQNLLPPSDPLPLGAKARLDQLKQADIPPQWEFVSEAFDDFVATNDIPSLQYLYEQGKGAALKAHTADYFFHLLMEHKELETTSLQLFQEILNPRFLRTLESYEHEPFARLLIGTPYPSDNDYSDDDNELDTSVVEHGLRSYVTHHMMSLDEEEEIETWLIQQLILDTNEIEQITVERNYWHLELEREFEEPLEEPHTDAYNIEAFLQTYEDEPSRAVNYFQQLPLMIQGQYMNTMIRSLIGVGGIQKARDVVDTFGKRAKKDTMLKPHERQSCIQQLVPSYIECVNHRGLIKTLKGIRPEGLETLRSYLGVTEEELCNIMFYRYNEDYDHFGSKLNGSHFYKFFSEIATTQKDYTKNVFYKQLLQTKLYLYPSTADFTDEKNPLLYDLELTTYLAIHFGMDNNIPLFAKWLHQVHEIEGARGVEFVYGHIEYLAEQLDDEDDESDAF